MEHHPRRSLIEMGDERDAVGSRQWERICLIRLRCDFMQYVKLYRGGILKLTIISKIGVFLAWYTNNGRRG